MSELVFRLIALAFATTYMTVRSVYEKKLGRGSKAEQWARAEKRDRIELAVVGVTTVPMWLYMLSPWLDFAAMDLPVAIRFGGALVTVGGIGMFLWSHAALAGNWSPFVEQPPTGELVTSGPYRWVRHPMYTSFLLYNGGMWLLTSNWLAGAPAFLGFLWMYFDRVGREEKMMAEQFGDTWNEYASRTGRVVPKGTAKRTGMTLGGLFVVLIIVLTLVPPVTRPFTDRWGATDAEAAATLPGDDLIPGAQTTSTKAVTIQASAQTVNALVRQQGYKRAGWHGWDWFYNATGSAEFVDGHYSKRVVPELQDIGIGDMVYINKMVGYEVVADDAPNAFVLYGAMDEKGAFIGPGEELPAKRSQMSWAWIIQPKGPNSCRLILRLRSEMQQQGGFVTWLYDKPLDLGGAVFGRKTLTGIKRTAEEIEGSR